ncbi:gliding motility lipoprotein GldB [Adhaeribacter aquaticus]|uniref:gliding motility lipoprotein GldB n=1 Tax=Adhaeribacter aquaticus TaxID=299567 RepID=UPI00041BADC3|nr:gliding motility lipoprotein GldB [Adhaeribacter aquaticus]
MQKYIAFFFTLSIIFSCQKKKCEINPEIAKIKAQVTIERLENSFFAAKDENAIRAFLAQHPSFAQRYLQIKPQAPDGNIVASLTRLTNEPNLNKFAQETENKFKDLTPIKQDLETAFKHLKYYYPTFIVPKVNTYISGLLGPDLFVSDSLLVLGIDYFAGKQARYRPQQPEYILQRYEPENMVPAVVLQLSSQYNKIDLERSNMMAEMINYGKSLYFTERMMPCTPDSLIIGYSDQQIADVRYNEGKIWAHFIEKGLLYETDHFKVNKYVGERPNIPEIGKRCPGRVATWVGWQIVRKYMAENPDITLQQLMNDSDSQKIFLQSKYKPKKRS